MSSSHNSDHSKNDAAPSSSYEHGRLQSAGLFRRARELPAALLWTVVLVVLLVIWVATGEIKGGSIASSPEASSTEMELKVAAASDERKSAAFKVRVANFKVQNFDDSLIIRGRSFSDQQVDIRAETSGVVLRLPAKKGQFVKKGTLICEVEDGARAASLLEAEALVSQAEGDYAAAKTLEKRGHTASLRVLQNKAALDKAMATLARAKLDMKRTKITAPFDGFIEAQPAKEGSLLAIGDSCAQLVSLNPLRVIGAVRERDINKVRPGQGSLVRLITGEEADGIVRYIAASSDTETRTFRIEVEIPNPLGKMKSGVTADIEIPLESKKAVLLPPSILTLDDKGVVGVRSVNTKKQVEFNPVSIISEKPEGIWVEALPANLNLITVGQDFVKPGQMVEPVPDLKFNAEAGDLKPGS
ncbi:MAG: hemolysin D [Rhodomicrobium sp.]|nr:MAG: hemolysin D [Rhodomicrobium sp.]